jgi:hypothetical protein
LGSHCGKGINQVELNYKFNIPQRCLASPKKSAAEADQYQSHSALIYPPQKCIYTCALGCFAPGSFNTKISSHNTLNWKYRTARALRSIIQYRGGYNTLEIKVSARSASEREKKSGASQTQTRAHWVCNQSIWQGAAPLELLSARHYCKLLFIQRYVKIVLLEWHKHTHSFCRGRLKYCGKHTAQIISIPKSCDGEVSASLGRALFIHEAMHHTGLRHLGK